MPPLRDRGEDILLLFRLFAMQMADKYRLPKITLTDEAKRMMLQYKWPGNVRQLKNITEQMSVLRRKRELAETLRQFIPQDPESMELTTVGQPGQHSYESEREILYKILYELRGNITDLRRDMMNLRKQLDESRNLQEAASSLQTSIISTGKTNVPMVSPRKSPIATYTPSAEDAEAEEIETEPESLNLNDLGRQWWRKPLSETMEAERKPRRNWVFPTVRSIDELSNMAWIRNK